MDAKTAPNFLYQYHPGWRLHESLISYVCFMDLHPTNALGTGAGSQLPVLQEQLESWRENWKYINYLYQHPCPGLDKTDVPWLSPSPALKCTKCWKQF